MRATTRATLEYYLDELDVKGDVLEVGGYSVEKCAAKVFPAPRFRYRDMDLETWNIPDAIIGDITDCRDTVPDESFDVIISCDVFEHIDRPWLAAAEMARILRPGGIVLTRTMWSWRNHPCPIDYWRFSPECLDFLFQPLECLEKGYDLRERRSDYPGFWKDGKDSVPVDALGGFRENWASYSVHRKGPGRAVQQFKYTDHPEAVHLRQDTQGTVTSPAMLGHAAAAAPVAIGARLQALDERIGELNRAVTDSRPLSVRAFRRVRRQLSNRARARARTTR